MPMKYIENTEYLGCYISPFLAFAIGWNASRWPFVPNSDLFSLYCIIDMIITKITFYNEKLAFLIIEEYMRYNLIQKHYSIAAEFFPNAD